jgi:hypothetical protein
MLKGCKKSFKKYGRTNSSQVSLNLELRQKNVCDLLCYSPVIDGHGFRILEARAGGV